MKIGAQSFPTQDAMFANFTVGGVAGIASIASGTNVKFEAAGTQAYCAQISVMAGFHEDGISVSDMWLHG